MRQLFQTKTARCCKWSAIASFTLLAFTPISDIVSRNTPERFKADADSILLIVKIGLGMVSGGGALGGIVGRAAVGDVESSNIFPGPNIGEISKKIDASRDLVTQNIKPPMKRPGPVDRLRAMANNPIERQNKINDDEFGFLNE